MGRICPNSVGHPQGADFHSQSYRKAGYARRDTIWRWMPRTEYYRRLAKYVLSGEGKT